MTQNNPTESAEKMREAFEVHLSESSYSHLDKEKKLILDIFISWQSRLEQCGCPNCYAVHNGSCANKNRPVSEDEKYIIYFEDPERKPEFFAGYGADEGAQRRFEEISTSWNATLFQKVKHNWFETEHKSLTSAMPSGGRDLELTSAASSIIGYIGSLRAGIPITQDYLDKLRRYYIPKLREACGISNPPTDEVK